MLHRLIVFVGPLLVCAASTSAQSALDSAAVELLAARHMLDRHTRDRVHLDSAFAPSGAAPGMPTSRLRPARRTRQLADSLKAQVSRDRPAGVVYLILSEPEFVADAARVTVTISYSSGVRGRSFYETLLVILCRDRARWRYDSDLQLGIS